MSFTAEQKKNARHFMKEWEKRPLEPKEKQERPIESYQQQSSMTSEEREALKEKLASLYFAIRKNEVDPTEEQAELKEKYNFITAELTKLMRNYKDKKANLEHIKKQYVHEIALLLLTCE